MQGNLHFSATDGKSCVAAIPGHDGSGALEQKPQSQLLRGLGAPSEESASSCPAVGHRLLKSDHHRNQPGRLSQAAGEIPQVKLSQAGLCPPSPKGLSLRLPGANPISPACSRTPNPDLSQKISVVGQCQIWRGFCLSLRATYVPFVLHSQLYSQGLS